MIIIRCDSSLEIGGGHLKRCLNIAEEFKRRGKNCEFISRNYKGNIINQILLKGYKVRLLDKDLGLEKTTKLDAKEDAIETIRLLNGDIPEIIIVDNYDLSLDWEKQIKKYCLKIVVIDDLPNRKHYCDVLLDHNYKKDIQKTYDKLTPKKSVKLLGTEFALLDPSYSILQKKIKYKEGKIKNILVTFSGSDQEGMTLKTLNAFIAINREDIKLDIIINNNSPSFFLINEKARNHKNIKIYGYQETLIPFMLKADYAIGGGGMNALERCCLGLPSTVISLAENQKHVTKYLFEDGLIRNLGYYENVAEKNIVDEFNIILNLKSNKKLSKKCKSIVDGLGVSKFVDFLLLQKESINIRHFNLSDLKFVKSLTEGSNKIIKLNNKYENPLSNKNTFSQFIAESKKNISLAWISFIVYKKSLIFNYSFNKIVKDEKIKFFILEKAIKFQKDFAKNLYEIQNSKDFSKLSNNSKNEKCKITFCSSKSSWINKFIPEIILLLINNGYVCSWVNNHEELIAGDLCFYLSYEKIVKRKFLNLNNHNLVVHESDLPEGKGWSPLSWQILEGKNKIPITIFEAEEKIDSGRIYSQEVIEFNGYELFRDLKHKQWEKTKYLILDFIKKYELGNLKFYEQNGKETFYRKRSKLDSKINPEKSIKEQFNLLRIADSENYPNFFELDGHSYKIIIDKLEEES